MIAMICLSLAVSVPEVKPWIPLRFISVAKDLEALAL